MTQGLSDQRFPGMAPRQVQELPMRPFAAPVGIPFSYPPVIQHTLFMNCHSWQRVQGALFL